MARPTDEEVIVIEKIISYSQFPGGECVLHQQGHTVKHQGQPGGRGREGETWVGAFIMVPAGKDGWGRVSRFSIRWFEQFQQPLGCWYLGIWPQGDMVGRWMATQSESSINEVLVVWPLDLLVCVWKSHPQVSHLLPLVGTVSSG